MTLARRRNGSLMFDPFETWNSFFEDGFAPVVRRVAAPEQGVFSPPVEIAQNEDSVVLRAELPGLKKDDIELTVHRDTVTLKGSKKDETERKDGEYYYSERRYGEFARTFSLPRPVNPEAVEARYENGILQVTIPVAEEAKPRKIEIRD